MNLQWVELLWLEEGGISKINNLRIQHFSPLRRSDIACDWSVIQLVLVMDPSKHNVVQITISHDSCIEENCMPNITQLNLIILKVVN